MARWRRALWAAAILTGTAGSAAIAEPAPVTAIARHSGAETSAVYQLRLDWLADSKAQIAAGDPWRQTALNALVHMADEVRAGPNYSVTFNAPVPPSGDKQDYLSIGPYWWPDPEQPDGLPWIRRDGQVNRAVRGANSDSHTLGAMTNALMTLALAHYFTDEPAYGARAAELVRVFFLDKDTRMNPHLKFGQGIPGRTQGRGIGIIESRKLMKVADAIGLLTLPTAKAHALSEAERQALTQWFADFLQWLQNSPHGQAERDEHNNHGTFYDAQVVHLALITGNIDVAKKTLTNVAQRRIDSHLTGNGSQPHELARTRPFHYSAFNLQAHFALAQLGEHLGQELWSHRTPEGGSLFKALDYLNNYAQHPVTHDDLVEHSPDPGKLLSLNQIAALVSGQRRYRQASLDLLRQGEGNLQCLLLFPLPATQHLASAAQSQHSRLTGNTNNSLCRY